MTALSEKYKPLMLADFAGLERPRAILSHLTAKPYSSAWLLLGPSGTGKTTLSLALVNQIGGELHHIPSRSCDLDTIQSVTEKCHYYPFSGQWHFVLIDEADQMTTAAQLALLSKLDTTAMPPNTIFLFTANDTSKLEGRFLSRVRELKFEAPSRDEFVALLRRVWSNETEAVEPDLAEIAFQSRYNVRDALMRLELELICPSPRKPAVVEETEPEPEPPKPAAVRPQFGGFKRSWTESLFESVREAERAA